jgi:hypothetical protein
VGEIEEKGIGCPWSELDEQNQQSSEEVFDRESQELWNAFSLNSSFSKSHASTIDVHPSHPSLAYYGRYTSQTYYYDYSYKPYEEGSLYQVFPEYIHNDARTTVMIRNIPNKYTIKELADEIDLHFDNTYDFLYLPCDIKNQCNVGYGFINFLTTEYLKDFYEHFQGKKWARFRSEKVIFLSFRSAISPMHVCRASTISSSTSRTPKFRRTRNIDPSLGSLVKSPTSLRASNFSE